MRALDEHVSLWASAAITNLRVAEWPAYGTAEWLRLPAADPRRAAAILAAAEMWRRYGDEQQLLEWFAAAHRARPPIDLPPAPRQRAAPRPLHATPGWPPVAIPGQPGKYLTYRVETAQ
ncbi:hypothetical protein ACFYPC_20320 [Streptomyces sp. NPDC005808]|uniref:hypothetical protein n=1 Tax=Streptomyces sp. NPDC005808 TaxID=3364734 RepID=UPI0036A9D2D3